MLCGGERGSDGGRTGEGAGGGSDDGGRESGVEIGGRNTMVRIKKNGVDAWCLGFINGGEFPRTPIVIGGLQLEDHLLQFDLENYRFGFSSSASTEGTSCSNFNFTSINTTWNQ